MMSLKMMPLLAASMLLLAGCGEEAGGPEGAAEAGTSTQASWVLSVAPADAMPVAQAKANAGEGDEITIRGRIGGRKEPVTAGSPVFTIVDLELPHCGEIPGDMCKTPWDYCCETAESITANTATIQLASGDPMAGGLEALDVVIVRGKVQARPNEDVLTIKATGVYVEEE